MPYTRQQQEKTDFRKFAFKVCYTTRPQFPTLNIGDTNNDNRDILDSVKL